MKLKVLVNTPNINKIGGVANFYQSLNGKFSNEIKYNYIGGSSKKSNFVLNLFWDYVKFVFTLIIFRPSLVHLNPSLDKKSILRDAVYVLISKLFFRKILIYWHGWQTKVEDDITKKHSKIFRIIFNLADSQCVLASDFKNTLLSWGFSKPIYLETTIFNDSILNNFDLQNKPYDNPVLLFLSRIEESKGIFIALESFKVISKDLKCKMLVAGTGEDLEKAKKFVNDNKIENVEFLGFISGDEKNKIIQNSTINFFPTFYGEGMPISILESMACGSIIITRPVGGIKDFFINDKMGYTLESKDPEDYVEILRNLLNAPEKIRVISEFNHKYALENFKASKVVKRIENIYSKILNNV